MAENVQLYYLDTRREWHTISLKVDDEKDNAPRGLTARVYPVPSNAKTLAKYYKNLAVSDARIRKRLCEKVIVMAFRYAQLGDLKDSPIAWPLGPLFSEAPAAAKTKNPNLNEATFCGYIMPRVANPFGLDEVFTDTKLGNHVLTNASRVAIARKIAAIVQICHDADFIIGDMNGRNFLVSGDTLIPTLIDCDSFQFTRGATVYTTDVGMPEYSSPGLLEKIERNGNSFANVKRTQEDDEFALAVLIFQILMGGVHPFDTLGGSVGMIKIPANIRARRFPYVANSKNKPPLFADTAKYARFDPQLKLLFEREFTGAGRVQARDWIAPLEREERRTPKTPIQPPPPAKPGAPPKPASMGERVMTALKKIFG
jgi:DNA-binding helix-hairpin-helix protein with protein kinase domain